MCIGFCGLLILSCPPVNPESFAALTADSPEPMLLLSMEGVVLAANRQVRASTGSGTVDPVGRHLSDLVTESEAQVNRAVLFWLSSGFPAGYELGFLGSNGTIIRYRAEAMRVALPDLDGRSAVLLRCADRYRRLV